MSRRQTDLFPELPDGKKYVSDYPDLAAEWHPTKNGEKLPEDFLHGSNKKVWWVCEHGHEYQSMVFNRTMHGKGCAYCSGQKVSKENNLSALYPEVAKLWSPKNSVTANKVLARSAKTFLWQCEEGHEWEDRPHNLVKKKFPCPQCHYDERGYGLRKATPDYNLASEFPHVAEEWHHYNSQPASFYMPKSNDKVWWICEHGHEWEANIDSRTKGNGCPFCGHKQASSEYNFAVNHPDLLDEWDYDKNENNPSDYLPKSNIEVWWKCIKGHQWKAPIYRRTGGSSCPNCTNQTSRNELRILTELASVFDDVRHRYKLDGAEVDVFLPEQKIGIEYDGKYWHGDKADQDLEKNRHLDERGIKLIRVREAPLTKLSEHDLIIPKGSFISKKTMNLIAEFVGAESLTDYLKKEAFVAEETYLAYLDYFPSPFPEQSLAAVNPTLSAEWHPTKNSPLTPENFKPSAKPKVWWMCEHGHEWKANIYSRNGGGHSCPVCMGFKASDENCMAKTHSHMAAIFHPTKNGEDTPQTLKAGTGKLLWWRCKHGHEWQQTGDKLKRLSSTKLCRQCRSLANKSPDVAAMWHPILNESINPEDVDNSSGKNRWWFCLDNPEHVWSASPNNMTAKGRKSFCPHCRKK